jgi:hypothetical protein
MMIKLIDLLREAKQVGTLYHFTYAPDLLSILESNKLNASKTLGYSNIDFRGRANNDLKTEPHVSFTRGNIAKNRDIINYSKARNLPVGLEVDGDKLSNNYAITPYSMFDVPKIDHPDGNYEYGTPGELEERVYSSISNLNQYLISILITKRIAAEYDREEFIDYINTIKQYGIPIKYFIFPNRESSEREFLDSYERF